MCFLLLLATCASAQTDTAAAAFNKKRLLLVAGSEAALYSSSLIVLNEVWYKDYPKSSFHFFNDADEWKQMDKAGHVTTSYYLGRIGIAALKWSNVKRNKAIWYGGMLGFVYLGTVEMLDGYSAGWGFSAADLTANAAGSLLCIGQELAWDQQRITLKYSFMQSEYSVYRPNLLGKDLKENLLKDYNGQTYWLSINPSSFMSPDSRFPKWLNIAVGYGANGMTGGSFNPPYIDANGNQVRFERYRQYYLSLDVDLTRLPIKSKAWKVFATTIGFIKIPAPALEFNKYGVKGNLLGF
jgi:uncharacterized protein YfiM (DUF2279 family)